MKNNDRTNLKRPTIIAPVCNKDDILPILKAGAREVYGGVIDPAWDRDFGQYVEMNRRSTFGERANFTSYQELTEAVKICADNGAEFHLTVNALFISQKYHSYLERVLYQFAQAGGKAVIISDPTLISLVLSYNLHPVISSCADVVNSISAEFYKKLGCRRIIFPRDMLLGDIEAITENVTDVEYEAFLMNGACRLHDSCCLCMHGTSQKGLCDTLDYEQYSLPGITNSEIIENAAKLHNQYKQSYFRACGLCAIFRLIRCVDSLKIVGRNANLNSTLSNIQLAHHNIEIALHCKNEAEYIGKMIKPLDSEVRCRNYSNCYYIL